MDRSKYIGSSDAISILNGNWHELWMLKTGRKEPDDLSRNFKVQLGVHTESFHLDWTIGELCFEYDNYEPVDLRRSENKREQNGFFFREEMVSGVPFGSHPDAVVRNFDSPKEWLPVEVKHTGRFRSASDAVDFYMPQLQHHMFCMGAKYCLFSVIRGNEAPERIWVEAHDVYIQHYVSRAISFWNHILEDTAPAPFIEHTKPLPSIVDSIKRNGFKRRDLGSNNMAGELIANFIETKPAVDKHNSAKADLKALMMDDEDELYHPALTMKRNKRGSILFKLPKEQ